MRTTTRRRKRETKNPATVAIVTPVISKNPRLTGIAIVQLPKRDQVTKVIGASPTSIEWSRSEAGKLTAK